MSEAFVEGTGGDIPHAPSKRRYPDLIALYTVSAQVSLLTFQSLCRDLACFLERLEMTTHPKPTRGIWWPLLSLTVGEVMLAYDLTAVLRRGDGEVNL